MDILSSLYFAAPELILSLSGLALLMVAAFFGKTSARTVGVFAMFALAAALVVTALMAPHAQGSAPIDAFSGLFRIDSFAIYTKILIYIAAIGGLITAPGFFDHNGEYRGEYPILILFSALGMGMMVSAIDLMTLYIGLELTSLSSYILASFSRSDARSAEAGLKYFVLGALASGILLYGMSLIYGFAGATDYASIGSAMTAQIPMGMTMGIVFMLVGMSFKIAAVPFHMWTPDVYEGAPTPVTAFFATAPKIAAVGLLMRLVLGPFGEQAEVWRQIVMFVALASIVVGALGAIGQNNIKRLLAYSSINNVGFILIGLAAGSVEGASAMLIYLTFYLAMTLGGFVAVQMLRDSKGAQVESISDLAGLSQSHGALALCLAMIMFSLAGIPPLMGFWGKFVVFRAAVSAEFVALAALGIAASVIGAFYYLKVIKVMYFDQPAGVVTARGDRASWLVLGLCALAISPVGFVVTSWIGYWTHSAATALLTVLA